MSKLSPGIRLKLSQLVTNWITNLQLQPEIKQRPGAPPAKGRRVTPGDCLHSGEVSNPRQVPNKSTLPALQHLREIHPYVHASTLHQPVVHERKRERERERVKEREKQREGEREKERKETAAFFPKKVQPPAQWAVHVGAFVQCALRLLCGLSSPHVFCLPFHSRRAPPEKDPGPSPGVAVAAAAATTARKGSQS